MVPSGVWKTKIIIVFCGLLLASCAGEEKKKAPIKKVAKAKKVHITRPTFSADTAYAIIQKQIDFGPRVPNTPEHKATGNYLTAKLRSYNFEVIEQEAKVTAYNGVQLEMKNIIGSINPEKNNRVLLMTHWDTRPIADQDDTRKNEAIDGANDGASGVGVLLEIARQLQSHDLNIGVDIILFDTEDYGQPSNDMRARQQKTWCLGSQYWAANPHKADYSANYGILLDMVGAKNAFFTKESISMYYAPQIVEKVWGIAKALGHGNYFVWQETTHVGEDDHLYVNRIAKIPSIDIIQYEPKTGAFGEHWHTHDDNIDIIDKATLQAVGETVLSTVLQESK